MADYTQTSTDNIASEARGRKAIRARELVVFFGTETGMSYKQLAGLLKKDRSTIYDMLCRVRSKRTGKYLNGELMHPQLSRDIEILSHRFQSLLKNTA